MDKKLKIWGIAVLAVVLTCLWPCVFLFAQNAGEARFIDIFPFFGIFLGTAVLGWLALGAVFREVSRAAFLCCLFMLVVINFSLVSGAVERLLPWFYSRYQFLLVAVVLLGLTVLLLRKKPDLTVGLILIALTFGALTVVSVIQAVPKLLAVASMGQKAVPVAPDTVSFQGEPRNVYYLLFDEYGGDENLSRYFDFDNSEFYGQLEDRGFSVSHSTYNTESCWTDTLIPNLLNLDYVASDEMPERIRREYLREPLLFTLFQGNGYQVNLVNHRAYLRDKAVRELTKNQIEDNISEYLFNNSIYCKLPVISRQITLWMFRNYRDNYRGPLDNAITALKHAPEAASGPTLTVSYIQCPHAPFVYNADGTPQENMAHAWYWLDETLYPNQLQYINSVILETVDNIQQKDPEAVILLLSDHGARVPLHMVEQFGGPRFDAEAETPVMQSALCCVYVPGQTLDIEGDTCINATRKVFNAAFGTAFPMIPPAEGYILPEIYNAKS